MTSMSFCSKIIRPAIFVNFTSSFKFTWEIIKVIFEQENIRSFSEIMAYFKLT